MLFFFKNGVAPMMIRALPGFAYELLLIFPGGLCLLRASFAYASFIWIKSMKFCNRAAEFLIVHYSFCIAWALCRP